MTDYPIPQNSPDNIANDIDRLLAIRQQFSRPIELLGVASYEISSMYMPNLFVVIGETVSYRDITAMVDSVQRDVKHAAATIGNIRLRIESVANAVRRAGGSS